MAKFRKKPVVIEAMEFRPRARQWPPEVFQTGMTEDGTIRSWVRTASGNVPIAPGDWICWQFINGRRDAWPVKPGIFAATYEPVNDSRCDGDSYDGE